MFVVINAPDGTLGDKCHVVGVFRDKRDAQAAIMEDIACVLEPGVDDPDDFCIGENHGTCYLDRPDSPEWHIFEL